jgi:hypothetical protein
VKLNLGCGFHKKPGFVNVDSFQGCEPDQVFDLSQTPWPWAESSADEAHFDFSLEQIGETRADLFSVIRELFRVTKDGATTKIWFFHPRHDQFYMNPLCRHRLSPDFFRLLSVKQNLAMIPQGGRDNPLGLELGVNFEMTLARPHLSEEFRADFEAGRTTEQDLLRRMRFENNICHAVEIELRTIKTGPEPGPVSF